MRPKPWLIQACLLIAALLIGNSIASAAASKNTARPAIASRYFHTTDNVRLHFLEVMPSRSKPRSTVILLIPGWSMPASIWKLQLEGLGREWHTIALDPRGQGLSEIPSHGFNINRRSDDIHEFRQKYPELVVVGWSLGALEVLNMIHRHGKSGIMALILVDSSVGEGPATGPSGFPAELRRNRHHTLTEFAKAMFRNPRSAGDIRNLVNQAMRMPLEASLSLFPANVPREIWRKTVLHFDGPLLYAVTPQFFEQARLLMSHRPGTRIERFPDAGHALFADAPDRFNQIILELASSAQQRP